MVIKIDAFAYPDSADVNGVTDPEEPTLENPAKRPFLVVSTEYVGEWRWQPTIDVDTGNIVDWPQGVRVSLYDKPCDDCAIFVDGINLNDGEYVPRFLRPNDRDDDYIVINIDENGHIEEWDKGLCMSWINERKKTLGI